eukprot:1759374-Alexandrium_andersonii.AAC.1
MDADRAPAPPPKIAADVGRGNPAALIRLGLAPEEDPAPADVALPQEAVEVALMNDPLADPLAGA